MIQRIAAKDVKVGQKMMTTNGMREVLEVGTGLRPVDKVLRTNLEGGFFGDRIRITVEDVCVREGKTDLYLSPEANVTVSA